MKRILTPTILAVVASFLPQAAQAACSSSMSYVFVNGTSALDATTTNANNSQLLTCLHNIDNTMVNGTGFYASQIIPTSGTQATFGSSQTYTFPYGIIVNGNPNGTSIYANQAEAASALIFNSNNGANHTGIAENLGSGFPAFGISKLSTSNTFQSWLLGMDESGNTTISGQVKAPSFFAGTAGTATTGGALYWGVDMNGFTTADIGSNDSSSPEGVPSNLMGVFASSGFNALSLDYNGDEGLPGSIHLGGSVYAAGSVTATGNLSTSGAISAAGNISGAQITASSGLTVTGTSNFNSANFSGSISGSSNLSIAGSGSISGLTNTGTLTNSGTIYANGSTDFVHSQSSGCTTVNWNSSNGGATTQGVSPTGWGTYCNSSGSALFNVDSSGNTGTAGTATAQAVVSKSSVSSTLGSGASGDNAPMFYANGGGTTASFHTVLITGTTSAGGCTGSPQGGSNCYSVTLPTNLAFSALGTFACMTTNEIDNNGSNYQNIRNNNSPTTYDGKTFWITGGGSPQTVSAVCSGY